MFLTTGDLVETLLEFGFIPVINENDTVATDEIMFGDNDKLAALTAVLCKADLLILASDIEGLYDLDPKIYPDAKLIQKVKDPKVHMGHVTGTKSEQGSGGMKSKLVAAEIAQKHKIPTWILNGGTREFLKKALAKDMIYTEIVV